jgi:hypothetical protein
MALEELLTLLDTQQHRRFIKSHLPTPMPRLVSCMLADNWMPIRASPHRHENGSPRRFRSFDVWAPAKTLSGPSSY